jgi:hypothetical protein
MVDIHSIAAFSHPSHREQEIEREVTSRSRAGRSRCDGGRSSAMKNATATQHHHMAGMVWTPSLAVGVEATLVTAHRLLNNPPLAHASPSVTEQWHHNVDQFVVAGINTPHHEGG